ncbi:MAG: hypothetical protein E6Q73_15000 [Pseudorhodobacter sp.]|nr:MAG: hypothetical protein E6Q73_15000 [Pseudorhodobacter sp.]
MPTLNSCYVNETTREVAESGMRVEGVSDFLPGTALFRFVQRADVADAIYISSPWWFQASSVRRILEAARAGHRGESLASVQASRMAALSSTWARAGAHYLLAARVIAPVTFLWGAPRAVGRVSPGQTAASGLHSDVMIEEVEIVPDPRCVQLFLPGMENPALSRKVVSVISRTKMRHSEALAEGEIEVFLRSVVAS